MKSDFHRETILLTNGVHNNLHLHEKPRHHLTSLIESTSKSTSTGSPGKVVGYNGSQVTGCNNMSVHEDPRITHKVNLAAAFHDHISCTKLPSQISKNGGDISSLIGASLNNGSCIDANNSLFGAAAGACSEDKIQIKKLKDMILMQLDLIQHQQEQLLKKERQLQGLKHDREALCSKIEKMESRINLLTRKLLESNSGTASPGVGDSNNPESISELNVQSSDSEIMISCMSEANDVSNMLQNVFSTTSPSSISTPTTIVSPRTCNSNLLLTSSNQSPQATSGTEILSSGDNEDTSDNSKTKLTKNSGDTEIKVEPNKEIKTEPDTGEKNDGSKDVKKSTTKKKRPSTTSTATTTTPPTTKNASAQVNKGDLPVMADKPANSESSKEANSSSTKKRKRSLSSKSTSNDQQSVNNVNCKSTSTNVNVLETEELYDLYNCRQEKSLVQSPDVSPRDSLIRANQIEVPSWRIINIPDDTSTDDIESLDDDVFLKRHSRLENDERRRKRWDIQRLREQKLNERLRSGRYYYSAVNLDRPPGLGQNKLNTLDLISFFPDPKEVQFIEVSDKIPVMAFGLPIPKLPPKHFKLPWKRQT